jgi:hypothetical protein
VYAGPKPEQGRARRSWNQKEGIETFWKLGCQAASLPTRKHALPSHGGCCRGLPIIGYLESAREFATDPSAMIVRTEQCHAEECGRIKEDMHAEGLDQLAGDSDAND